MNRDRIFTVQTRISGFTDQLIEFKVFHKLGVSLGYKYWHKPLQSPRSANLDGHGRQLKFMDLYHGSRSFFHWVRRKLKRTFQQLIYKAVPSPPIDIYEFLGFNAYFLARNKNLPLDELQNLEILELEFSPELSRVIDSSNFSVVQDYVRGQVEEKRAGGENFVLRFKVFPDSGMFFRAIDTAVPDQFDLRSIYFNKRRIEPWPSIFPAGKIKTLIHIRQGDTALIDTPWNTFVPLYPENLVGKEFDRLEDIPNQELFLTIPHYYDFYRGLSAQFTEGMLGTLLFSDGFVRSERRLYNKMQSLQFSPQQARDLRKSVHTFNKVKFRDFKDFDHFKMVIGEGAKKLRHLIHSFMFADLVIVGRHQNMVQKMLNLYCDVENMPVTIFLIKADDEERIQGRIAFWLNQDMRKKTLVVNMATRPDYAQIAASVRSLLAI